jgi:hypothetical protein
MTARLRCVRGRLSPRACPGGRLPPRACPGGRLPPRACAIALAVLVLGAAFVVLALSHHHAPKQAIRTTGAVRARPSRVSAAQIVRASHAARTFLAGYLPFAYGRASASSVPAVTTALRGQLMRDRAQVTPVERSRRPRVLSLSALAEGPDVVVLMALIDDGGIANYAVTLTLRHNEAGWRVSSLGQR